MKSLPKTLSGNKENYNKFLKGEIARQKKENKKNTIIVAAVIIFILSITFAYLIKDNASLVSDLRQCEQTHSSSYCARHLGV